MLCGIQTFQSRPVELLDPVKKPEEEEEDAEVWEVAEVELDDEVDDVLLENDDEENHPVFDVELVPEVVEQVVWLFWKTTKIISSFSKLHYAHLGCACHLVHGPQFWSEHWLGSLANQVRSHNIWQCYVNN